MTAKSVTTPLSLALAESPAERATPLAAFKAARRSWLQGNRLNLSALADELGVSRATLMRWVGNKELLLGEILWSLYKAEYDRAKDRADAKPGLVGVDYLAEIYHEINLVMVEAKPLRQFLAHDPKFGLSVLTSNASRLQERLVEVWTNLLKEQIAAGHIKPQMEPQNLAYFMIRIGEGAVYSDLICGREPILEPAIEAIRLLLASRDC